MNLTITIPYEIPSQNKREHQHWSQNARDRQRVEGLLRSCGGWHATVVADALKQEPRAAVLLLISRRPRLIDQQNLHGGAKALLDALKNGGLIVDDSPRWLTYSLDQELGELSRVSSPSGRRLRRSETVIELAYSSLKGEP
jgi:hypothetical protein